MNDAEYDTLVAKITSYLKKWSQRLGLGDWHFTWRFFRGDIPDDPGALANCTHKWQYKSGVVRVSATAAQDEDDERLNWIACHELLHAIVQPLAQDQNEEARLLTERVVTELAQAAVWAYEEGKQDALKEYQTATVVCEQCGAEHTAIYLSNTEFPLECNKCHVKACQKKEDKDVIT